MIHYSYPTTVTLGDGEARAIVAIIDVDLPEPESGLCPSYDGDVAIALYDLTMTPCPSWEAQIDADQWRAMAQAAAQDWQQSLDREWAEARADGACIPCNRPGPRLFA
jgi:hypothetical protein